MRHRVTIIQRRLRRPITALPISFIASVRNRQHIQDKRAGLTSLTISTVQCQLRASITLLGNNSFQTPLSTNVIACRSLCQIFPFSGRLIIYDMANRRLLSTLRVKTSQCPRRFNKFLRISNLACHVSPTVPDSIILSSGNHFIGITNPQQIGSIRIGNGTVRTSRSCHINNATCILYRNNSNRADLRNNVLLRSANLSSISTLTTCLSRGKRALTTSCNGPTKRKQVAINPWATTI